MRALSLPPFQGPVLSSQLSQLNRHREKMNSPEYEVVESVVNSIRAKFAEQEQNRYGVLRAGWLAGEWCCVLAGALRRIKRRDEAMHELRKVVDILQDGPTGDIMYERLRTRAMAVAIPLDTDLIEQIRVAGAYFQLLSRSVRRDSRGHQQASRSSTVRWRSPPPRSRPPTSR